MALRALVLSFECSFSIRFPPSHHFDRQEKFQIFGDCEYSPPLLGMIWIVNINVFRSKKLIVIKINDHFGGQKMAYYALAFLATKLRAGTALCNK